MDGQRLPGTSRRERIVVHVDMDCFYAACERRREPALEDEPLVVGMGYEHGATHGAVATASYEAREYGVDSAMPISEALELLPRRAEVDEDDADSGVYRPVDLDYYETVAEEVKAILRDHAETVREVSIDEAYLDVTGTVDWDGVGRWAESLKSHIEAEVDVVASVGVAPTMSAAKVASDHDKPDGLVVVQPGEVREFFAPLPVEDVHGVGPVTARELAEMEIETAGDLAAADPEALSSAFGERGREIRRFARGDDDRDVTPKGDPKSLSRESAFTDATEDSETVRTRVRTLAGAVADRADREDARYQTIGIKVVTPPFDVHTRAHSLPGPVSDPPLVESVAADLLTEFEGEPVRKVGVRVSNLDFSAGEQASLDGFGSEETDTDDQTHLGSFTDDRDPPEGQASLSDFES